MLTLHFYWNTYILARPMQGEEDVIVPLSLSLVYASRNSDFNEKVFKLRFKQLQFVLLVC